VPAAPSPAAADGITPATPLSWDRAALSLYLVVASLLTVRLALGLVRGLRLLRRAARITADWTEGRDVRLSAELAMPVTIGHSIVLPVDFRRWDAARRRAVLAHEASHAARGDFYILLLAALNCSLFWFNPAAWWLDGALADLAEASSDAAALAVAADRLSYARILIELAGQTRHSPAGIAMARRSTVRRRVDAILAGGAVPAQLTAGRLALVAAGMIPAILAAAGATTTPGSPNLLVKQRMADQARPRTAIALLPEALAKFAGYYAIPSAPELPLVVTVENGHLFAGLLGQPASEIFPESDHQFFTPERPGQEEFRIDAAGRVTSVVLHWNGSEFTASRLDPAAVREVQAALAGRIAANTPQPGSEAALRGHIGQIQRGEINDGSLAYGMAASIRAILPQIRPDMLALGPVVAVAFEGVGLDGMDIYRVTHANGARRWRIRLTGDGRIESMWFSPLT